MQVVTSWRWRRFTMNYSHWNFHHYVITTTMLLPPLWYYHLYDITTFMVLPPLCYYHLHGITHIFVLLYISKKFLWVLSLTFLATLFALLSFHWIWIFNIEMVSNSIFLFFDVGNTNKCGHSNLLLPYLTKSPSRFLNFPPKHTEVKDVYTVASTKALCIHSVQCVYTFSACKPRRIYLAPIWA